jgi:hypothetical protein
MTQRYMHLSPAALDAAIGLLDQTAAPARATVDTADRSGRPAQDEADSVLKFGDVGETGSAAQKRSMNPGGKLAVRQGFEPWVQVLARTTV